ncbi:25-hydroxyvitamin D-1 alpha hydroxylase, mitochondrial [Colletotrichum chlorophyti]|uniref:25-hydroxyvitamin D-1 alpha hydroxylase, mitochondrial n=1 Tax=Colletotrichum chlorophyti TaxID=708187 RepID=A0A1Q8RP14_9PEZI|nr:25-hydroxyvitamin D-1 alpha hydroxylase, mitochondrial [Colletotrichum chlorophyti]
MLAIPILLVAVVLLARWYYKPGKTSPHKEGDLFPFPDHVRDHVVKPASLIRNAQAQCENIFSTRVLPVRKAWFRRSVLGNSHANIPAHASPFAHGMGGLTSLTLAPTKTSQEQHVLPHVRCAQNISLNKIFDAGYIENARALVASLSRYIGRTEGQEHTSECAVEETHRCALEWTTRNNVELFGGVSDMTQKTVVRTLMGEDFYGSSDELLDLLHSMERDAGSVWTLVLPDWFPHPAARRLRHARIRVREIVWDKLNQRYFAAQKGSLEADLPDYITHILSKTSTAPLRQFLPSHLTALMFSAQNSIVAVVSWVVICLLRHPDVMNAVRRDARSGTSDQVLLQACIKETTRYYAGMKCLCLERQEVNRPDADVVNPASYPYPDTWMPGRWLNADNKLVDLEDKGARAPSSTTSGDNGRECPGEKMAAIIITQTLTTLLRCYDITWASPDQPRVVDFEALDFDHFGLPWLAGGLRVRVSRRVWPELAGGC